jgi:SET domain-containing protein
MPLAETSTAKKSSKTSTKSSAKTSVKAAAKAGDQAKDAVSNTAPRRTAAFEVRNSKVHGNGVFATRAIPAGTRIVEYKGERISWKEAVRRENEKPADSFHTFFFSLDDGKIIDGGSGGNNARWINHSCEPTRCATSPAARSCTTITD